MSSFSVRFVDSFTKADKIYRDVISITLGKASEKWEIKLQILIPHWKLHFQGPKFCAEIFLTIIRPWSAHHKTQVVCTTLLIYISSSAAPHSYTSYLPNLPDMAWHGHM